MINFKTEGLRQQWNSGKLHPRLRIITLATAAYMIERFNVVMVITSIFRVENKNSVHAYWRGLDFRTANLRGSSEAQCVADWVNKSFLYDPERELETALYGDKKHKDHIHLQVTDSKNAWQP